MSIERINELYKRATANTAGLEAVDAELGGGKLCHGTKIRILQDIAIAVLTESGVAWELHEPLVGDPTVVLL